MGTRLDIFQVDQYSMNASSLNVRDVLNVDSQPTSCFNLSLADMLLVLLFKFEQAIIHSGAHFSTSPLAGPCNYGASPKISSNLRAVPALQEVKAKTNQIKAAATATLLRQTSTIGLQTSRPRLYPLRRNIFQPQPACVAKVLQCETLNWTQPKT